MLNKYTVWYSNTMSYDVSFEFADFPRVLNK